LEKHKNTIKLVDILRVFVKKCFKISNVCYI
jgi:hypothetical protein